MTRSRDLRADDAQRLALRHRVARLKMAAWAAAAGVSLALWSLVGGSVAATATAVPSASRAASEQGGIPDLFRSGSTLGDSSSTPVLRSHGS